MCDVDVLQYIYYFWLCLNVLCDLLFFFFKQKTAYEMRISDWSSDVCSSDLAELDALQAMPDSGIDYSDAPTLTEDFWKTAERGRFYKPIKQQVTARLDADVLAWLKSQGKGYQARMNAILRREMLAAAKERRHA